MNDTINLTGNLIDAASSPLTVRAIERVVEIYASPRFFTEFADLMEIHDGGIMAAFLLFADDVMFDGPSLSEQFEDRRIGIYENWGQAKAALIEYFGWDSLLDDLAEERDYPFNDLLTWNDKGLRNHARSLDMQLIETGDVLALFRPWSGEK